MISVYTIAPRSHLENSTEIYLCLHMMTDSVVLKHGVLKSTVAHFTIPIAMGVRRNFSTGGQSRHFAYLFQAVGVGDAFHF